MYVVCILCLHKLDPPCNTTPTVNVTQSHSVSLRGFNELTDISTTPISYHRRRDEDLRSLQFECCSIFECLNFVLYRLYYNFLFSLTPTSIAPATRTYLELS